MLKWVSSIKVFIAGVIMGGIVFYGVHLFTHRALNKSFPELFTEDIEDRFQSYAIKLTGRQSLYVAKLQETESIERTSNATALWFDLPTMILKAEAPVEYNYFISLSAPWKFHIVGDTLVVRVPELGSSTPAVDIAKLKFTVEQGSILRNEERALEKMAEDLPGLLIEKAIANREVVREEARTSAEKFIRTWFEMVTHQEYTKPIKIKFPHDRETDSKP